MQNERRKFLAAAGSIGIASLTLPFGAIASSLADTAGAFGDNTVLVQADFSARLKDWFYLHGKDVSDQGDLQLITVRDAGSSPEIEQFSLVFRSRRGAEPLLHGYHEVAGEAFSLFIKHSHEKKNRQFYAAEFALLR